MPFASDNPEWKLLSQYSGKNLYLYFSFLYARTNMQRVTVYLFVAFNVREATEMIPRPSSNNSMSFLWGSTFDYPFLFVF